MSKGILLLLAIFVLAGCAQRAQGATSSAAGGTTHVAEVSTTASGTNDTGARSTAAITLAPAAGYAGTFVSVTGTGWPPSAMVIVKLADAQGRSPVLAAVAADAKGQFTTGFVYPVGDRWLNGGPTTVVAHTENGQVETTAPFAVVPPAGVVPPTPTLMPTLTTVPTVSPAATPAATAASTITATIPFTSGGLAATPAPTATPIPTAATAPTATAVPTVPPTAAATSTATSTAAPTPQVSPTLYPGPVSTIDELIAAIHRMPPDDLAPELANSLVKKLTNAQKQVDKGHTTPASNMLRAFQHEVAAQWGKKIDDAAATFLTDSAGTVITHLQSGKPAEDGAGKGNGKDKGSDNGKGNGKDKGKDKGNDKGNDKNNGNGNGNGGDKGKGKGHG